MPGVSAFFVLAGTILARFTGEATPPAHLVRPLLAAVVVALVAGVIAGLTERGWVAAVAVAVFIPSELGLLLCLVGTTIWMAARVFGRPFDPTTGPLAASAVMFVSGALVALPSMDFEAEVAHDVEAPAQYLILLDGYPRSDTLGEVGIDNRPFVEELESRGFDHYPNANSLHSWTQLTLLAMSGTVLEDRVATTHDRSWWVQERLRLPSGFVTVDSPFGDSTFRGTPDIGGGGVTAFDVALLRESLVAYVPGVGRWVMDSLRTRVDSAFDALATTSANRVFAHIGSPHQPYLWGPEGPAAPPLCWPCNVFWDSAPANWEPHLAATLKELNERVLETVDAILARRPEATIVLFSDHGGRFSSDRREEWHKSFLAALTPGRPELFAETPRPDRILSLLGAPMTAGS